MASERDFLKTNRAKTPELMPGMEEDQEHNAKYKAVEDMSDSEEEEMDLSNSDDEDTNQPRKKQARTTTKAADGDTVPRWSNPDPYTVLPPIDASERKKKDVVKLIRKARVTNSAENAAKTDAAADDFISLDFGDEEFGAQPQSGIGVEGAPTQPRSSQRDNFQRDGPALRHGRSEERDRPQSSGPSPMDEPRPSIRIHQLLPRPALDARHIAPPTARGMTPNAKPSVVIDLTSDPNLSSRKRTNRDEIKEPPRIHESTKGKSMNGINGDIVKAWKPINGASPNPWISLDHSDTASMGIW
jgi:non-canonical poly(A) RNA polymerase PAPD5/7